MKIIIKILIVAAALWVATQVVAGIDVTGKTTTEDVVALLGVALIFGVINAVLKPIIKVVGCAFYVLTLGLFALIVNAGLMLLTSWIAEQLSVPFHVDDFWSALWGALIVGIVSWVLDLIIPD
ncbi:phage holin family protein [Streptosporangium sp. KLBMP 9127]|nr:phage holin family protein [Streptosporangium sp. KLBMP 9127]